MVGTQIAHISPINKGDIVWTVNAVDLPVIGRAVLLKVNISLSTK